MKPTPMGRGRARGRATPSASSSRVPTQQQPKQMPPAGQAQAARPPQPAGAWARPPVPSSSIAGVTRQMAASSLGGNGGGGDAPGKGLTPEELERSQAAIGRGGVRGRRALELLESLRTKPVTCVSKQGITGKPLELFTNMFKLLKKPDWVIHQYRVDFSCDEDREIVKRAWLRQHKSILGTGYLFDGTMIFSSLVITRPNETCCLTSHKLEDNSPVNITIKWVSTVQNGDYTYLMIFNLLVRRCLGKLDLQLVGRNLFDAKNQTDISEYKLSVWPGYLTSIRQYENDLLMCCEISHKVMRMDTAWELMYDCKGGDFQKKFLQSIVGEVVLTPYNNKTYRVDDVKFDLTPRSTFTTKTGSKTYVDYYKERYNIKINDLDQPLLLSKLKAKDVRGGKTEHVLLIPQLCRMTGLTERMRSNFQLMKALAGVMHMPPAKRMEKLEVFNKRLQSNPAIQEELKGWDMQLSSEFVKVNGRQLLPENIICGAQVTVSAGPLGDWTRSTQDKPMLCSAPVDDWVVVYPQRLDQDLRGFVRTMRQVASKMQFNIPEPALFSLQRDNASDIVRAVEEIVSRRQPSLIFFAVSNVNADRYSAIKKKCYVDRAITSQVVCAKNLAGRNLMTVATKVAIQINCKLGGAPWTVNLPKTSVMVVGFDVCHDASDKSKSFGAMVATSNSAMTSWYCNATPHTGGEELSNSIALDIQKAVRRWREVNQALPQRVLVYRDGVGDGQLNHVYNHEVVCVKKSLAEMFGPDQVKLGYVIVTKRIHTRLFTPQRGNPGPGTIVDDVITLPEKYDFYLVSQNPKQGTVSPTCYNVIEDNLGWKPDQIQRLTFMLTHLYYNLSSTVGVPAPVQYAHKLAFLVSQSLHRQPNPQLCDRLFFI